MNVNEDAVGTASHLPVLRWAFETAGGPVLEFGGGMFSTAYLAEVAAGGITVEHDPEWRHWIATHYPRRTVVGALNGHVRTWGVVLVDHGEGEWTWIDHRAEALESVRGRFTIGLVHDWHIGIGHRGDLIESWPYHGWFAPDDGTMHTAIVSDTVDVGAAVIPGGRVYTGWDDAPKEYPN